MRSRAAAGTLESAGLKNVYSMEGGIHAWQGMVAHGEPEMGMPYFSPAVGLGDIVVLAWALEEGSRRFYSGVLAADTIDEEARRLFEALIKAEEHHKQHLLAAYRTIAGQPLTLDVYKEKFADELAGAIMEGGVRVDEALAWTEGQGLEVVLELSMSLEINSFDLYVKMGRKVADEGSRKIFKSLAEEEQAHLKQLSELLDARVS